MFNPSLISVKTMEIKSVRAIMIDPTAQAVSLVSLPCGNDGDVKLSAIYDSMNCSCVTRYKLAEDADLVLDDEGLYKDNHGYSLGKYPQIFAGKSLIFGVNWGEDGATWSSVPDDVNMENLKNIITWRTREEIMNVDKSFSITSF